MAQRFFSLGRLALEQWRKNISGSSPSAAPSAAPIFAAAFLESGRAPLS